MLSIGVLLETRNGQFLKNGTLLSRPPPLSQITNRNGNGGTKFGAATCQSVSEEEGDSYY
jgi:hypothetical protein